MFLAGALSRVPLADVGPPKSCLRPDHEEVCCIELEDVNTAEFLQVSNDGLKNIQCLYDSRRAATRPQDSCARGMARNKTRSQTSAEYWTLRDKIGVYNRVLYKGNRVIIPKSLCKEMMI